MKANLEHNDEDSINLSQTMRTGSDIAGDVVTDQNTSVDVSKRNIPSSPSDRTTSVENSILSRT